MKKVIIICMFLCSCVANIHDIEKKKTDGDYIIANFNYSFDKVYDATNFVIRHSEDWHFGAVIIEKEEKLILVRLSGGFIDMGVFFENIDDNKTKLYFVKGGADILEFGDTDSKKLLQLLKKYPDFSKYKKVTMYALLKIETIGKKTAVLILEGFRNIEYVEELTGIYKTIISSHCHRILELKEEIEMLDRELEETGEKSAGVKQLKSIMGVGTKLSSRLAGEIGDIRRFNKESQLAVYCGVACIDDDSGKSKKTKAVYKANRICKATMIEIAGCTIRYVQESKTYYEKKRAEGKDHNHALRCLARQLIKVIFKMLTENREYIYKGELKKAA